MTFALRYPWLLLLLVPGLWAAVRTSYRWGIPSSRPTGRLARYLALFLPALIVALLEGKQVFVFDEWAADQDPLFRKIFYQRLLPELKSRGKTVVAVTHDDRYFAVADQVIKLEEGKVVQTLRHEMELETLAEPS